MYPIKATSRAVRPSVRIAQVLKSSVKTPSHQNFHTKNIPSMQIKREKAGVGQKTSISNAVDSTKPKLCTPCPYPTTYIPDPQQYSKEEYEELSLHFENRVKDQWRKIWFGLYQVGDEDEVTHATMIRRLYAGAGMAALLRQPGHQDANIYFRGYWECIGLGKLSEVLVESGPTDCWPVIGRLKMYDGIALDNMQYISLLLKDYEQQVHNVSELHHFLEGVQIAHPCYYGHPTEEHVKLVMRGFHERANGIATALAKLDLQMGALQRSIKKEALMLHGRLKGVETLHFKKEVLKP